MTSQLLNPTHIAILLIVVLLVLGPKKLPDTGRALGRSMREFRDGITGREPTPTEAPPPSPPAVAAAPPPPVLAAPAPVDHAVTATAQDATATAAGDSAGEPG
jgi:sec-independent protein translocase protein TatA